MSSRQIGDEHVYLGRRVRLDRRAALELLRDVAADRHGMRELRRLYAEELGRSALHTVRDEVVLAQLAERIAAGALSVALLRRPEVGGPPEGEQSVLESLLAAAQTAQEEPKKTGTLTNPRWSKPRVEVGEELEALVTYKGFEPGQSITLTFFECNKDGARKKVGSAEAQPEGASGDHKVAWKRDPDSAQADLEEDAAEGDSGPLEYRFTAEAKDVGHAGESGPLWLTNTVTVKLVKDEDGAKHETPRVVVLRDALGEEFRTKSQDGEAKFEKVLVGPMQIRLAEVRFSDLEWSKPKVPVGEKVEAVFKYEDAIEGMTVSVVVHEFNADGTSQEVERVEGISLEAASGEARAPWTRSEDEAQADVETDAHEGDAGPLEYRYFVETADGAQSEASAPLWLTHTMVINLQRAEDGESFEDGVALLLVGADGTAHHAKLKGGEARFEGVVCGPVTLKLAPKEGEA